MPLNAVSMKLCLKEEATDAVPSSAVDVKLPLKEEAIDAVPLNAVPMNVPTDEVPSAESPLENVPFRPEQKKNLTWTAPLSLFVLNRVVELVREGPKVDRGMKEEYITRVSSDVLDFTGLKVTNTQIYNHLRKWRARWIRLTQLK